MPPELEAAKQTIKVDDKEVVVYDAAKVEEFVKSKEMTFATEKQTLEQKAKDAAAELAKVDQSNKDFDGLRKAKETAEATLKEATEKHEKEVGELRAAPLTEHRGNLIKLLAGDDKDLLQKIEFHLKNTVSAMPETKKEEIDTKLKSAYQLAVGGAYKEDFVGRVISSAGGASHVQAAAVSDDLKNIGSKFGLDQKDFDAAKAKGLI